MGIQGLLPFIKKSTKNSHIKKFEGQTAAIDGYGWLYKAAFGCAAKLGMGELTDAYVKYIMKYLDVMIQHGVKPVVIFDGRSLPAKEVTNAKRREHRKENRKKALNLVRKGDKKAAWEYFVKSIEVTHEMVQDVIQLLRQKHIDYIIAPYEADTQLAYLQMNGLVDVVITEDSDLVVFGVTKAIFKFKLTGDCQVFDGKLLHKALDVPLNKFSFERFRQMCILSGCDYLESLNGIGLTRAKKFINHITNSDKPIAELLTLIPTALNLDVEVTEEYIAAFLEAENSFLYQLAYDPVARKLVPVRPNPSDVNPENMKYCGEYDVSDEDAYHLAIGNMHTKTMKRLAEYNIDTDKGYQRKSNSLWCRSYKLGTLVACGVLKSAIERPKTASLKDLTTTASLNGVIRKRRIVWFEDTGEQKPEELSNSEILSLYQADSTVSDTENGDKRSLKKLRVSLTRCDTIELKASAKPSSVEMDEDMDATTEDEQISPTKRKQNPFLKSPDIGKLARHKVLVPVQFENTDTGENPGRRSLRSSSRTSPLEETEKEPVCLIERGYVYDSQDLPHIVVKSKYFRKSAMTKEMTDEPPPSPLDSGTFSSKKVTTITNDDFQISLYNVDTSALPPTESQILDNMMANADLLGTADQSEDDPSDFDELPGVVLHKSPYFGSKSNLPGTSVRETRSGSNSKFDKSRLSSVVPKSRPQGLKKSLKPDAKQRSVLEIFSRK